MFDGFRAHKKIENEQDGRVQNVWTRTFQKVRSSIADLSIVHGMYYAGMGAFGGLTSLQDFGLVNLGITYTGLDKLSWVCFLCANIYMLQESVRMYLDVQDMEDHPTVDKIRLSAVMGIVNSLGYCMTAAVVLFGGPAAAALVLGGISVTVGCIKILYDHFVLSRSLDPQQAD